MADLTAGRSPEGPTGGHESSPAKSKVFCVGLNKTGTTTFGAAMSRLGYRVWGWNSYAADFTLHWHEGVFTPTMQKALNNHEAFEDLPWPLLFRQLDERVPDAKFVLTIRRSPEAWLQSIQTHIKRADPWAGHFLIYGSYDPVGDRERYLRTYNDHNAAVRAHFASRPGKLLEMCFEQGDGWRELCAFLGVKDIPVEPFPHENRRPASDASPSVAASSH